jgi:hypothetical protein
MMSGASSASRRMRLTRRLHSIAQALGVEVSYFYDRLQTAGRFVPSPRPQLSENPGRGISEGNCRSYPCARRGREWGDLAA